MLLMTPEFGYYTGADVKVRQKVSSNNMSNNADLILNEPLASWLEYMRTAPGFEGL